MRRHTKRVGPMLGGPNFCGIAEAKRIRSRLLRIAAGVVLSTFFPSPVNFVSTHRGQGEVFHSWNDSTLGFNDGHLTLPLAGITSASRYRLFPTVKNAKSACPIDFSASVVALYMPTFAPIHRPARA